MDWGNIPASYVVVSLAMYIPRVDLPQDSSHQDLGIAKVAFAGLREPTQVSHTFETCWSHTRTVEQKHCLRLAYSKIISYMCLRPPMPPKEMPTIFNVNLLINLYIYSKNSAQVTILSPKVGDHLAIERITFSPSQKGHQQNSHKKKEPEKWWLPSSGSPFPEMFRRTKLNFRGKYIDASSRLCPIPI